MLIEYHALLISRKNEDHVSNESDFTQQKQIKTVEYTNCLYTISLLSKIIPVTVPVDARIVSLKFLLRKIKIEFPTSYLLFFIIMIEIIYES